MNKIAIEDFFNPNIYNVKAFNRTKVASNNKYDIIDNVAYNEVDSVVYIKNKQNLNSNFVAGRKYSYAIECITGNVEIEFNQIENLTVLEAYDDLSDEEILDGKGTVINISSGEIAIFELDEAIKYSSTTGQFIEYKIAKDGGIK